MTIEVSHVTHAFQGRRVLSDVTVELTSGRTGIIGPNGSGKSTFARLLNGLVVPDHGRVRVDGLDTRTEGRDVRQRVGFVFQDPDTQIVLPTVAEDVGFGLRTRGLPPADIAVRVDEALRRFGLEAYRDHPAHLLSGGEKQLLALCSALVLEPVCLVLDEPTTFLDLRHTRQIMAVIEDLTQTVVIVTHDLDLAARCDRVVLLDDGRLLVDGGPDEAIATYRDLVA